MDMESCLFVEDYKNTSKRQNPKSTFQRSALANGAGGDFDNRYSQRGEMGSEAGSQSILKKKFMYIHYVTRMQLICSKMVWILSRSKTFNTSKYRDDDGLLQIAKL
jgi:hypothetical protein